MSHMTQEQKNTIKSLREQGFAVVLFNPDELKGVDPDHIESELVHLGNDMIHDLSI